MQSNTVVVDNQAVNFPNISGETRHTDPFRVVDGHYVGHDGFVVPRNFDEFHQRFPGYVRNWVRRHVDRSTPIEDVDDWTQDLLLQMLCLPAVSKHREAGKKDIVQTFDPNRHYGANAARFFNFINFCLRNKLSTMRSARMKNPICRAGNVSLGGYCDESESGQVDDEFCHRHSGFLRGRCQREEKQRDARQAMNEFADFVRHEDSSVLSAMEAIAETTTPSTAVELLGTTKQDFCRTRSRLRRLGKCFQTGDPVPRKRRPYKRRVPTLITLIAR